MTENQPVNMKRQIVILFLFATFLANSCKTSEPEKAEVTLTGPYLGQTLPGNNPELFAPGIVSTGMFTRDIAMTPDGNEIYFCVAIGGYAFSTILYTKQVNGQWTHPEVVPHMEDPDYMNFEPCISPDGQRFFFLSNRPDSTDNGTGDQDIWGMDRLDGGWSEPYNLGLPINTDQAEFYPSVTGDGTMYFTRKDQDSPIHNIYRSRLKNGKYTEPEKLPDQVNCGLNRYNAFIAQDESFIIVPAVGMPDSYGGTDYYIVFRNEEDQWSDPVNMGEQVNTRASGEHSAYVTSDGKYLFFMSTRLMPDDKKPVRLTYKTLITLYNQPQNGNSDIYWMKADFINELNHAGF
jgi:hypothetical protein